MMKKLLALLFILTFGVSVVAFATDSPVLTNPPTVGEVSNGLWVKLEYTDQSKAEIEAVAKSVKDGKTELQHFMLTPEDSNKLTEMGFDLNKITMDDLMQVTVGGYTEKPESVTFTTAFTVPYKAGTKVAVLMGVGDEPGPYQWTVEEGMVNEDGTMTITLSDFPEKPFLMSLFS